MIFGYVRVSKNEQNQDLQLDALGKAGCEKIFHDKVSGASKERPEYAKMIRNFGRAMSLLSGALIDLVGDLRADQAHG